METYDGPTVVSIYPYGATRYDPLVEAAVAEFVEKLFTPDDLGQITGVDFKEFIEAPGNHVEQFLGSLVDLQEYRRRLGNPILELARMYLVPPELVTPRLDDPEEKYSLGLLLELNMLLRWDSLLSDWRLLPGISLNSVVPVQLRLFESFVVRQIVDGDRVVEGVPRDRWLVFGRTHRPYLANRLGWPGEQFGNVAEQVTYWGKHGTPMSKSALWTPSYQAYNEVVNGASFTRDPLATS
jgi:hypothetical protein